MFSFVDYFLDRITMYRLVLYVLIGLVGIADIVSFFNLLPFTPITLLVSVAVIIVISYATNKVFSHVFEAPANVESVYITSLILALIITPGLDSTHLLFLGWAAILSQASKYILAINHKHIFNPAVVAVVITSFATADAASWWIGTTVMFPFALILGLLVIRKMRLEDLVFTFISTVIIVSSGFAMAHNASLFASLQHTVFISPLFFLASIMLTEPMTIPYRKQLQIVYGVLVGLLFVPDIHVGSFYFTPEMSLLIGNVFAYMVNPKSKLLLRFKEKIQLSSTVMDFVFTSPQKLAYIPGQYMEWTLQHPHTDSRGNRRFFTLASSPTESDIRLGVKFSPQGSSYKKALTSISPSEIITAGQLAGDFVLPKDPRKKLVFIAGGIGITPFRSMIKYLVDVKEHRDVVLVFINRYIEDITYLDVFEAGKAIGLKAFFTLTDAMHTPSSWTGLRGRLDTEMLANIVPDYKERLFYLSGPHAMVVGSETVLKNLDIPDKQIKKDFFPGLT